MKNLARTIVNEVMLQEAKDFCLKQRFSQEFVDWSFREYEDGEKYQGFGLINTEGSRFEIVQWGTTIIEGDVVCPMEVQGKCIR